MYHISISTWTIQSGCPVWKPSCRLCGVVQDTPVQDGPGMLQLRCFVKSEPSRSPSLAPFASSGASASTALGTAWLAQRGAPRDARARGYDARGVEWVEWPREDVGLRGGAACSGLLCWGKKPSAAETWQRFQLCPLDFLQSFPRGKLPWGMMPSKSNFSETSM